MMTIRPIKAMAPAIEPPIMAPRFLLLLPPSVLPGSDELPFGSDWPTVTYMEEIETEPFGKVTCVSEVEIQTPDTVRVARVSMFVISGRVVNTTWLVATAAVKKSEKKVQEMKTMLF
jgi:hypothetical protein